MSRSSPSGNTLSGFNAIAEQWSIPERWALHGNFEVQGFRGDFVIRLRCFGAGFFPEYRREFAGTAHLANGPN